jgi:hypothetical protein
VATQGISITSVDNKRMPTFAQRLELPPGYHYITANFEGFYTVSAACKTAASSSKPSPVMTIASTTRR